MTRKTKPLPPALDADAASGQVAKLLERAGVHRGHRPHRIFEEWLDVVEANLRMMPAHVEALLETGKPAEDPPDVQELWRRRVDEYKPDGMEHFAQAYRVLLESTQDEHGDVRWGDVLGTVYMTWVSGNEYAGQFFTPWNVCLMMAQIVTHDLGAEVMTRLRAAVQDSLPAQAALLASLVIEDQAERMAWIAERVLPLAPSFEPLTVCDPCVGSGRMLLATASRVPYWQVRLGLVGFYGQDIDALCVKMARVNCLLYGLSGGRAKPLAESEELNVVVAETAVAVPSRRAEQLILV